MVSYATNSLPYIESLFLNVKLEDKSFIVGAVYRPPNGNLEQFHTTFQSYIHRFNLNSIDCFICGDFNIDFLEPSNTQLHFVNILHSFSLPPLISRPTRITDSSATILDNIITNNPSEILSGLLTMDLSDHLPVFSIIQNFFNAATTGTGSETIRYRLVNEITLERLTNHLYQLDMSEIINDDCVDRSVVRFTEVINHAYNLHCPILSKTISFKTKSKPWISADIVTLIKRKNAYLALYHQGRVSKTFCNRFRNRVTDSIRFAKREYYNHKFDLYRKDVKGTWAIINDILKPGRKKKCNSIRRIIFDNRILETDEEISKAFNNYFSNIGRKIGDSVDKVDVDPCSFVTGNHVDSFFFHPVTASDINSIVLSFNWSYVFYGDGRVLQF